MTLPVVSLSGTPYAMGLAHGESLRDRIAHNVDVYFDRFARETLLESDAVHEVAAEFAARIGRRCADYYAGMEGIAAGSGFDLLDIAALNARYEILYYRFGQMAIAAAAGAADFAVDGCTSFVLMPDATESGRMLVGQNWDWIPEVQGAVLRTSEPDGLQTMAYTECGIVGAKIGFNSAGVGLCINGMTTMADDWKRDATPFHVRCYRIMRSRTLDDAVGVLAGEPRAIAGNFLIVQAPDRAIDVEAAPDAVNLLTCDEGCLTHANHFVDPGSIGVAETPNERRVYSRNRQRRLREQLIARLPVTIEAVQECLRDTLDDPFGICRHRDPAVGSEQHYTTVASVVMDIGAGQLYITDGPPDAAPYQQVAM